MNLHAARRLGVVALLAAPTVARAADETYTVRLFRPSRAGDVTRLDATFTQHLHEVRTVRGQPPVTRDADVSVHLVGRVTVRAVDGRGVATRVRCEVAKAVPGSDGRPSQFLAAGTVVEATNPAGAMEYRRPDGEPVAEQARNLRQVLAVRPPDAPTADDLFPTDGPKAVGDTWPLDAVRSAEYDRAAHVPPAKDVAGQATLVGLAEVAGTSCMVLRRTLDASDVDMPTTQPGATRVLRHTAQVYTDTVPLNPATHGGTFAESVTNDYVAHGTLPDGTPYDTRYRFAIERHLTLTPVRP